MLELKVARSGLQTAIIRGRWLHSAYDPVREAERFATESLAGCPSCVIVLGSGLGYLLEALSKRLPRVALLAFYYTEEVARLRSHAYPAWYPTCGTSAADFLRAHLSELDVEGLKVLEWPPSALIFPQVSLQTQTHVRQVVAELAGSLRTTIAVGKRWLRNVLANFLWIDNVVSGRPFVGGAPLVIAASGPSLNRSAQIIQRYRDSLTLWAVPSAVPTLREMGIRPDLVVLTDPGYYALYHLPFCESEHLPVAMPLSAARGVWRGSTQVYLFCQPLFCETEILARACVRVPKIASHGTVAGSALELARHLGVATPVVFCGLDMCYRDIIAHARPNAFDSLLYRSSTRLDPHYHRVFQRAQEFAPHRRGPCIRTSGPLETYAGWFSSLRRAGTPVYRLLPSRVQLSGLTALDEPAFVDLLRGRAAKISLTSAAYPRYQKRKRLVCDLLESWREQVNTVWFQINNKRGLDSLISDPVVLHLAYFTDSQAIMEIKRMYRTAPDSNPIEQTLALLDRVRTFLARLSDRLGIADDAA